MISLYLQMPESLRCFMLDSPAQLLCPVTAPQIYEAQLPKSKTVNEKKHILEIIAFRVAFSPRNLSLRSVSITARAMRCFLLHWR